MSESKLSEARGHLERCVTQIEQMMGIFPNDESIAETVNDAREFLREGRNSQPEPVVFQLARPSEQQSEPLQLLAWCIAQFDGTSGAGLNHWIQSPEYRRACELIGQQLPPHDEDDEEADEPGPTTEPTGYDPLPNGELKCTCGCENFWHIEDVQALRVVDSLTVESLSVKSDHEVSYDDGERPRLMCRGCFTEYAIPSNVDVDFS